MEHLAKLCSRCKICLDILPPQSHDPVLFHGEESSPVLVVDDLYERESLSLALAKCCKLLGDTPYCYTSTLRCEPGKGLGSGDYLIPEERCTVWTNLLVQDRALILTTITGLFQMGVQEEIPEGEIYIVQRLGTLIVIPPLTQMTHLQFVTTRHKVERALKSLRLLEKP